MTRDRAMQLAQALWAKAHDARNQYIEDPQVNSELAETATLFDIAAIQLAKQFDFEFSDIEQRQTHNAAVGPNWGEMPDLPENPTEWYAYFGDTA